MPDIRDLGDRETTRAFRRSVVNPLELSGRMEGRRTPTQRRRLQERSEPFRSPPRPSTGPVIIEPRQGPMIPRTPVEPTLPPPTPGPAPSIPPQTFGPPVLETSQISRAAERVKALLVAGGPTPHLPPPPTRGPTIPPTTRPPTGGPVVSRFNPLQVPGGFPGGGGASPFPQTAPSGGLGGLVGTAGAALCDRISNPTWRSICLGGASLLGGQGSNDARSAGVGPSACPPGFVKDAAGNCVAAGAGGALARMLPGGDPGRLTAEFGDAVQTVAGVGIIPAQLAIPTLRCPPGMVLGKDNVCYMRSAIPRNWRKHPPARRPLLSAQDGKILRKAASLEKKVKRVAKQFGGCPKRRR